MIHIDGTYFKDELGRTVMLRGVNLGGSTKVPSGRATHVREGFYDHRNVSFVGRPFPVEEVDEHFARLKAWGVNFLRFLVTWEAIEHAGPGKYDEEYLDYLYQVVKKAGEHGIELFIDPHQDVWSRMSGGDGAPGWTFEVVGMDVTRFSEVGAAIVHAIHGDPFPRMIWPTNYTKLAAATMFTLFFGGNDFAPQTTVDGEPVQAFLQRHYFDAIKQVAMRLKDLPNVVGYDTMNEPDAGFIGWEDLESTADTLRLGEAPTPLESMLLGAGFPQDVEIWRLGLTGFRRRGRRRVNPEGVRIWRAGYEGIWRENGVWELAEDGTPRLIRPNHFSRVQGRPVDFVNDYFRPFAVRYAREIRSVDPSAMIFVEGPPGSGPIRWNLRAVPDVVHAAHWYDVSTLFTKRFIPFLGVDFATRRVVLGRRGVERSFEVQLARIKAESEGPMGGVPTLIGEFGIPFDLGNRRAYRNGDFSRQARAMDVSFRAMEANLLHCTLWNYTADNDNRRGDQWNGEDLSIFSRDQQIDPSSIHSGGRALTAVVRPYPQKVAGVPLEMGFDVGERVFEFYFRHDAAVLAPTEIFVPNFQYPRGYRVEISDGTFEIDQEAQVLSYHHSSDRETHRVRVSPA